MFFIYFNTCVIIFSLENLYWIKCNKTQQNSIFYSKVQNYLWIATIYGKLLSSDTIYCILIGFLFNIITSYQIFYDL